MRPARRLWLAALLALSLASCAIKAPVHGKLVSTPVEKVGRLDEAIVYVESRSGRGKTIASGPADSIVIVQGRFEPSLSATAVGCSILFRNQDQVFHSPFSRSPAAPFRGRPLRSGESRVVPVRGSGLVRVFCELHASEAADVLVLKHGTWTRADSSGRFSLGPLRRGRYTVHAWHPAFGSRSIRLVIAQPGPVSVDVRY